MSTWSYTKGANRGNRGGVAPLRVGKGHDYDHVKKSKKKRKNKIKITLLDNKKPKPKKPASSNDFNIRAMKLASILYKRMLAEPDFADEDKKVLWELAQQEAKAKLMKDAKK